MIAMHVVEGEGVLPEIVETTRLVVDGEEEEAQAHNSSEAARGFDQALALKLADDHAVLDRLRSLNARKLQLLAMCTTSSDARGKQQAENQGCETEHAHAMGDGDDDSGDDDGEKGKQIKEVTRGDWSRSRRPFARMSLQRVNKAMVKHLQAAQRAAAAAAAAATAQSKNNSSHQRPTHPIATLVADMITAAKQGTPHRRHVTMSMQRLLQKWFTDKRGN